jgi:DNA-binding response OmpR family regulator
MSTKKILLVDDDPDFVSAISTILKAKGFEVKVAYSANEGYEFAQSFLPDLIILDVNMETENAGFDLNKKLRTNKLFGSTPIIMLTGIDTISISNQIVQMYNEMATTEGFENHKVMKIQNADGSIAVDYDNEAGQKYLLLLDSFISKPVDSEHLQKEINKFLIA